MGLLALGLVLGSALAHATWNLAAKRASGTGGLTFIWLRAALSSVIYLPLALWFAHPLSYAAVAVMALSAAVHASYFLLLHHGYAVGDLSQIWRDHWREALTISVLGPLGYILVLYAFTLAPVSLIAPARELSIVVGTVFGAWLLHEPQGLRRLAGAAVVVAGVVALALS